MGTTLSSLIKNNQFSAIAGTAITQNSLVQVTSSGKVYPCTVSDYSAQSNIGGSVLAATYDASLYAAYSMQNNMNQANAQDSQGNIYVVGGVGAANTGLVIKKYSLAGSLLGSVTIMTGASASNFGLQILSNNNLVITWYVTGSPGKFSVVNTADMTLIVNASTTNSTQTGVYNITCLGLSGGGFVLAYNTTTTTSIMDLYTNAGVYVSSSASITSIRSDEQLCLKQLSNNNILLLRSFGYATNSYSIWTTGLLNVVASTSTGQIFDSCSVMTGYFAVSNSFAATSYCLVFNNSGVQQGSTISLASSASAAFYVTSSGLHNDGTSFWWITYTSGTGAKINQISTSGALIGSTQTTIVIGGSNGVATFDATTNNIVIFNQNAGLLTANLSSFDTSTLSTASTTQTVIASGTAVGSASAILCFDGAIFYVCGNSSQVCTYGIFKYMNTSILGVTTSSAVAGATVPIVLSSGYYQINALKGSKSKTFTMKSGANIYGNNGSITNIGCSLQGL